MSDRTIEGLIESSINLLAETKRDPYWKRGAHSALYAFQEHFDAHVENDILKRADAKAPQKVSIEEVALAVCQLAEEKKDLEVIAAWYKVLGLYFAEESSLGKLKKNPDAIKLRTLAQRLKVEDIRVTNYEPELSDFKETPIVRWWFEADSTIPPQNRLDENALLERIITLDKTCALDIQPAGIWNAPVLPKSVKQDLKALAKRGASVVQKLTEILLGNNGYFTSVAAAKALLLWLKKNHDNPEPDRIVLGRRLVALIEEGIRVQAQRPWAIENPAIADFKWLDHVAHGEHPEPLSEVLTEAYYELGPHALPVYVENVDRSFRDDTAPAIHLCALFMQKDKRSDAAVEKAWGQLMEHKKDYAGFLSLLSCATNVRPDIQEKAIALREAE